MRPAPPSVDAALSRAATLPSRLYTDPEALEAERDRVFSRTWQLAAHSRHVASPGDYAVATVARESVLLVRGEDGGLRAFSNVCRHRAGPVAQGCGRRRAFRCGYHGWSYRLDGTLLHAPEFEEVENFDPSRVALPEFSAAEWAGLVFVHLEPPALPLADWLSEVVARTSGLDLAGLVPVERREYVIDCNWKVYVDNYLEGYHIPIVHPQLFRELDYDAYRTETFGEGSLQIAPIRPGGGPGRRYANPDGTASEAIYFWMFPNLMLNIYYDSLSTNLIVPLAHDRTLTVFEWFFRDPDRPETRDAIRETVEFSDLIQQEDIRVCEAVQSGLASRTYDRGRFSVRRENGVHHFHRLLAGRLGGGSE